MAQASSSPYELPDVPGILSGYEKAHSTAGAEKALPPTWLDDTFAEVPDPAMVTQKGRSF